MAGDLEDFLRRAAQRRQAKAAAQQQASRQPAGRQRPQYSDSRTERVVRTVEPEQVLAADIVDDEPDSIANRRKRLEEAKRAAVKAESDAMERLGKLRGGRTKTQAAAPALSGNPVQDLINMLRSPGGVQQAILLREVLERPEHRW